MSRIGKLPIKIVSGVTVEIKDKHIKIKGSKGELAMTVHRTLELKNENGEITVVRKTNEKLDRSVHGTTRTLISNMMTGVTKGFEKKLEIQGVGYKAAVQGKKLVLNLGFSHPIDYNPPAGITITVDPEKKNILTVSGMDKQSVGEVSAKIRSFKKPEPYKGKGIRYVGEHVARKAGKAAAKGA
jgi:large subunit ribosomal protein L6